MNTELCKEIINIEMSLPVETIEYEKIKIWPYFRILIFLKGRYNNDSSVAPSKKLTFSKKIFSVFHAIKTISLKLLLKKNSTVIFIPYTSTGIRLLNGIKIDPYFNEIIEQESNITPIILNNDNEYIPFKKFVDWIFFKTIIKFHSYFNKIDKNKILNKELLYNILDNFKININIVNIISEIYSSIYIYNKYFNIIKPNKIYVICYYDTPTMAVTYAAKKNNIPVIEIQHGVIHKNHLPYIAGKYFYNNPYPDYLFCFGEKYKNIISEYIYKKENIFIIGYYYLNIMKERKTINYQKFYEKYNKYQDKIIITVGSLAEHDKEILNEIKKISSLCSDIIFIYKARPITEEHQNFSHSNIIIEKDLDIYQCMQFSHITTTIYSTIAIESLAFGTPVILLNIENLARIILGDLFSETKSVYYADTPEEYLACIQDLLKMNREDVSIEGIYFYADNHKELAREAIKKIIYNHNEKNNNI